jgi:hypothetical protein
MRWGILVRDVLLNSILTKKYKAMKRNFILIICFSLLCIVSPNSYGQNSLTINTPIIFSSIEVPNNWSPPTTINRENQFDGKAVGYGINLNYSFHPTFITKNKHISINVGLGYFQQRFDIKRPFDYNSFVYIIYYTDFYIYHCLNLSVGLTYYLPLSKNYFLTGSLYYNKLNSFRQDYTPTYSSNNRGFDGFTQTNNNQIDFSDMLNLAIGINKKFGNRFSVGLSVLAPVFVRWRNDKIFKDDPATYYSPKFSLGFSGSAMYFFHQKRYSSKS